jgi:acyl dehydratase
VNGLDALCDACPVDLGTSAALVITQEMVDTHAVTTGDAQWIHNDPERARAESPFGGPIVQGFLLLALLTRLSSELTFPEFGPVEMLVNYGFDRVRFVQPVPVGAAVVLTGSLVEVQRRAEDRAVLAIDVELTVVSGSGVAPARPSLAATWLFLAVAR